MNVRPSLAAWAGVVSLLLGATACLANTAYVRSVEAMLAPAGGTPRPLVGADDIDVLSRLEAREADAKLIALSRVPAEGQPFTHAARIDMTKAARISWTASVQVRSTTPVKKGDVICAVYHIRGGVPSLGGSNAVAGLVSKPGHPPYEPRRQIYGRRIEFDDSWRRIILAGPAKEDLEAGQLRFDIDVGHQRQWIEVGGYVVYNLGPNADAAKLPVTEQKIATTYDGREPDAPWRAAAEERIREHRQAPLTVRVLDAAGKPVAGAKVDVKLRRNAFKFGAALDGWLYMSDTPKAKDLPALRDYKWVMKPTGNPDSPDAERYRQEARRLFNMVVADNDMKGYRLRDGPLSPERSREHAKDFAARLRKDGFDVYGHVLVWPGFGNSPKAWRAMQSDPPALRREVEQYIEQTVRLFGDDVFAWDVANETYGNQDLQTIFGPEVIAEWFRIAHKVNPRIGLHLNEATRPGTSQIEMRNAFHETLTMLRQQGAPITGMGIQCHYGQPPAIEAIKAELDRYAEHGLGVWITEYDMYPTAPDEAAREALEGDFTRDFLTLCYSHPAVKGFTMWGFWDGLHWKGRAPMFRKDWSLKPAGKEFIDLVHGKWATQATGTTDATGAYATPGTIGDYDVSVNDGATTTATLAKGGSQVEVRLP